VAGTRFYERREVKDVVAYFRLIHNPQDSVSLRRIVNVPARGIGQTTMLKLADLADSMGVSLFEALRLVAESTDSPNAIEHPFNTGTVSKLAVFGRMMAVFTERAATASLTELFDLVVDKSGYRAQVLENKEGVDRWENVLELRSVADDYHDLPSPEGMSAFLEKVALVSDSDAYDEDVDRVTLITLHQAKGLEFPVVFIVGLEERLLPHVRSFDDAAQMEEERRLFYVGITRAKDRLYLVHSFRRTLMGQSAVNKPSRFIDDIPKHLVTGPGSWRGGGDKVTEAVYAWNRTPLGVPAPAVAEEQKARKPSPELGTGDRVAHAQFGEGVVISAKDVRNDRELVIAFDGQGVKRLLASFARLEKVG
jgi:DNA helicase-2/ATP-dependent DNA helicase PcrA